MMIYHGRIRKKSHLKQTQVFDPSNTNKRNNAEITITSDHKPCFFEAREGSRFSSLLMSGKLT